MKVTLTVAHGPHAGRSYSFEEHDNFIVGRASYAHFRLPKKDRYFSRVHFMVEVNPPFCRLMDMGSRNGTYVNDERVKTIDIHDGDLIQGGQTIIRVDIEGEGRLSSEDDLLEMAGTTPPPAAVPPVAGLKSEADDSTPLVIPPHELTDVRARYVQPVPAQSPFDHDDAEADQAVARDEDEGADEGEADRPGDSSEEEVHPQSMRFQTVVVQHVTGDITLIEEAISLLPGNFIDRINSRPQPVLGYLIVDEIGRGELGTVYRAICRREGTVVALKTIRPAVVAAAGDVERFLKEASVLKTLRHPNIVGFHEMGEAERMLYFAMDYVDGVNASQLLVDNEGPLAANTAVGMVCQLLSALQYAHDQGLVHRDIKPQNMLLGQVDGRGIVKLADFGLARTFQNSRLSGLTMMGDQRAAPQYISPEQITNYREANPASDQYSTAATLYHLLTGKFVFDFPDTVNGQFQMILQEEPIPIQQRRRGISDELAAVIHHGLKRDPDQRYADVTEMREALLEVLGSLK